MEKVFQLRLESLVLGIPNSCGCKYHLLVILSLMLASLKLLSTSPFSDNLSSWDEASSYFDKDGH